MDDLGTLSIELRQLANDHLQLAALELRVAGRSLVKMIVVAVLIGGLAMLAWTGLMASTGATLHALGWPPALTLLMLTALTLALTLLLGVYVYQLSARLGFPRSLRTLEPSTEGPHPEQDKR